MEHDPRALLDATPDPLVAAAEDGSLVFVSAAALALLGWSAAELVGQPFDAIVPPRLRVIGGVPFHRHLRGLAGRLAGGAVRTSALRRDGVEIEVDVTCGTAGAPGASVLIAAMRRLQEAAPFVDSGRAPALAGTALDEYRLVFENAPVGIFHFDARGVITACNDNFARMLGSSKKLLIGLQMLSLPDPDVVGAVREALAGKPSRYTGDYRSATGGKETPVRAAFNPIRGDGDSVVGGVAIIEDTTEQRQIEARLARADRMASIGALAAGVAHEINNPLAFVTMSLDLVEREAGRLQARLGPADEGWRRLAGQVADAREGAERVRVIVRDLRTFSRTDQERRALVDVERVLDSSINLASNEIRHRARLVKRYGRVPPVFADEGRLGQVFLNLLVNAAQAIPDRAPERHVIEVITDVEGGPAGPQVAVAVKDNGVGIDPAKLGRIFEPFWTDKPAGVGTGLGLSICHGIVASLGGEIAVQSELGKGTTFTVRLPARSGETPLEVSRLTGSPELQISRKRVLLIDDEVRLGLAMASGLRDRAELVCAASGREGIAILLADGRFDLVLCDLMMPDMLGIDVFEEMRRTRPELAERFVFITDGGFTDRARKFLEETPERPRRLLEKPFQLSQVEALLEGRR